MGLSMKTGLMIFSHVGKRTGYILLQPDEFLPDLIHFLKTLIRHSLVVDFKREYHFIRMVKSFSHGFIVGFIVQSVANMCRIDFGQIGQSTA